MTDDAATAPAELVRAGDLPGAFQALRDLRATDPAAVARALAGRVRRPLIRDD
ncbi:deoxyribose-phosphate aldolase, partial [Clavibacter lycopersici]